MSRKGVLSLHCPSLILGNLLALIRFRKDRQVLAMLFSQGKLGWVLVIILPVLAVLRIGEGLWMALVVVYVVAYFLCFEVPGTGYSVSMGHTVLGRASVPGRCMGALPVRQEGQC